MDAKVYCAAMKGSWEKLNSEPWGDQLTPIGNTVLHVCLGRPLNMGGANVDFVKNVLDEEAQWGTRSPLWHENDNGEIPLHFAARFGHLEAVEEFLRRAKEVNEEELRRMLMKTNKRKDTALHEAARGGYSRIVKLLAKADPNCPYGANDAKETPLYLAAERGCADCVIALLDTCAPSALAYDHKGPCGLTVLHILVKWKNPDMVSKMLDKDESLIRLKDDEGSTPLHHVTMNDKIEHLRLFLSYEKKSSDSAVYMRNNEGRTPLHVAALHLSWDTIKELIAYRPDCMEISDNRGQNAMHYAAKWACINAFKYFLNLKCDVRKLMNEQDEDGNTPLHVFAANLPYMTCDCLYKLPDFMRRQQQYLTLFNNQNLTAADIAASYRKEFVGRWERRVKANRFIRILKKSKLEDTRSTIEEKSTKARTFWREWTLNWLVVATLVATVSFAAGFTVPGGLNQNPGPNNGIAIMAKKAAFKAFLISDAIAFAVSSSAVVLYFFSVTTPMPWLMQCFLLIVQRLIPISIAAMTIAFLTGVYVVVPHSPALTVALFLICSIFFCFYLLCHLRMFRLITFGIMSVGRCPGSVRIRTIGSWMPIKICIIRIKRN